MTELAVLRLEGTLDIGQPPARIPLTTLPIAVREWLAAAGDRSANTFEAYHRAVSSWLTWCLAVGLDPHDVRRADAEAWRRWMRTGTGPGQHLAERSINQRIAACSSLYRRLTGDQLVARNPFETLARARVTTDHAKTPALPPRQITDLILIGHRPGEHPAHLAVVELLFTTAARASEIAHANLADLEHDDLGMVLWVTRKGGKRQPLPVTPDAITAIRRANAGRPDLHDPAAALLLAPRGGRYTRYAITRLIRRYACAAEIDPALAEKITAHSARRSAITILIDDGTDLRTAQTLAGHGDPRTTEGYVRARNDRRKHLAAAAALAASFHRDQE